MTGHVIDELPLLLTGEADRASVAATARHLRECDDCRDELISAIAAHAALMSAVRYAPDLTDSQAGVAVAPPRPRPEPMPLPDLSAVFAQVRAEVDAEPDAFVVESPADRFAGNHRQAPRSRRTWLVAAALVIAAGAGVGSYLAVDSNSGPASRSLALEAYGEGNTRAAVQLIGDDQMKVDASSLPRLPGGSYYEVWLTNRERTSMAPVGVIGADGKASLNVPAREMSTYAAIEVSVQDTAGVGTYSGHSVLRGTYA